MRHKFWMFALIACATPGVVTANDDDDSGGGGRCRSIRGELVEDRVTTGCNAGEPSCFLGELRATGLRARTHFRGDSSAPGPSTSPGWISYSGLFQYINDRGTIFTRETGVVSSAGAVTAQQVIVGGTGRYEGATGHFFVGGFNVDNHIETFVHGELCRP